MPRVELDALLQAGAHFVHITRRWNPKMKPYIFMERNGIHVIDLKKTQEMLEAACNAVSNIVSQNRKPLFVATKQQAKDVVQEEAKRCGSFYVTQRWLGGMLTNFQTIRKSVKRLTNIEKMESDGTFEKITKKERLFLDREREKLQNILSGVVEMSRLPGLVFVVDVKKEAIAVKEARRLGIPIVAIVDTNVDPDLVDYPIPANDDALKSVQCIARAIAEAVIEGSQRVASRQADEAMARGAENKEASEKSEASEKAH
ncbi:MAG: 30S ribosomal protein S2 [Ignavibacteriales bacterium]|nr:30S ribosomal protein S2 [Ignavibacteriales bacterium]